MIAIAAPLIGQEERAAVLDVLDSGQLAQGRRVADFERAFAEWCGAEHAVATSSGTTALHAALLAHGIGPGDEVITTSFSFIASANCILYVGATPVFADIEPDYFTVDPADIAAKITPKTRAIVAVHLYGQPCDMPAIAEIARKNNLVLIEDACQAHGASLGGLPVGSWGTACYSFYPTKNMTAGEGGLLTTADPDVAQRARQIRAHGSIERYVHESLGYNFRMTELQAAIALAQLPKLAGWNQARQQNAAYLSSALADCEMIACPAVRAGARHVFHQYTVRVRDRAALTSHLLQHDIGFGVYYPVPIHKQPLYLKLGFDAHLPQAEAASQEVLSLPVHPALSLEELARIAAVVDSTPVFQRMAA